MKRPRVGLILDNPLRDLDGLVLIAWHLSQQDIEAYIVPMHTQGFEVPALALDVLLANYARRNNWDLLKMYRRSGTRIAVLDTEGIGGDWWSTYGQQLHSEAGSKFIDQYICWGVDQKNQLVNSHALPDEQIMVTGCPRYDFFVDPWRQVMRGVPVPSGYILINTNFPVVNPRFSSGTKGEIRVWKKVGWGAARAERLASAAMRVFENVKAGIQLLAKTLPHERIILRPHPFERSEAYSDLLDLPNVEIHQDGTSLQWLNHAKALLHLNCYTAIEATCMGVEAISFEWLNDTELLALSGDPKKVSRCATGVGQIVEWLDIIGRDGQISEPLPEREPAINRLVSLYYHKLDGQASRRVADCLIDLLKQESRQVQASRSSIGLRQRIASLVRAALGFKLTYAIKLLGTDREIVRRRQEKIPSLSVVRDLLAGMSHMTGKPPVVADWVSVNDYAHPRLGSGQSIRIARAT